jgi:hypothetical protein
VTAQEALVALWAAVRRTCERAFPPQTPLEVLVADPARRDALYRQLRGAVGQLRRVYGAALPERLAVLAQRTCRTGSDCHAVIGEGSGKLTVIRLALHADGRELGADEVLAALAEQVHAIASGAPTPAQRPVPTRGAAPAMVARRAEAEPVPSAAMPHIRVVDDDDPDADPLAIAG